MSAGNGADAIGPAGTPATAAGHPDRLASHLERVAVLVAAGHLVEAEAEILRALAQSPADMRALKLLALVRFKLGRHAEAREAYQALARLAPEDAGVHLSIGLVALKLDWIGEATAELEVAARLAPADRRAWSYLGFAYARAGRKEAAADAFLRGGQEELARQAAAGDVPVDPVTGAVGAIERSGPALHSPAPAPSPSAAASALAEDAVAPVAAAAVRSEDTRPATVFPRALARPRPTEVEGFAPTPTVTVPEASAPGVANLTGFLLARLLPEDEASLPSAAAPLGDGVLRFAVDGTVHVRSAGLLAASGEVTLGVAHRRAQGRALDETLGDPATRFLRCDGRGEIWLSSPDPGSLLLLHLEDDILYLREGRTLGFADPIVWESGRLPGDGLPLLQLRGSGRVVIDIEPTRVRAFKVPPTGPCFVERSRLLGWVGRVIARADGATGATGATGAGRLIACEGEGVLLLCTHGHLDQAAHQRTQPRDDGAGTADPDRSALHR